MVKQLRFIILASKVKLLRYCDRDHVAGMHGYPIPVLL